jgi:outer membrane protein assembly factor BamB
MRSYDLTGNERRAPVVIRDMNVIHDSVRDEILVVDQDRGRNTLWSIDAHDFTLHWKTMIEKRVNYDPVATRNYIILMNSDGEYQAYDRLSIARQDESRLAAMGRYEGDIFPSAPPAANDTHVFVPSTNANAMHGFATIDNSRGVSSASWAFPRPGEYVTERFLQISMKAAADGETVAFVNNNKRVYLVDAQNGDFRASSDIEGLSRTPPVIKDDLVFVGSDAGQLFAWQKSGESAFVITLDGIPYGDLFVLDGWIFVRTLEIYDKEVPTEDGKSTRIRAALRPGKLSAYHYDLIDVPNDRSVFRVVDGDPKTPYDVDPIWSQPDVGQEVLMANNGRVYVLEEINEEFMTDREKAKLKADGRLVKREDELRTVSRRIRILDINTGKLLRPEWDINLADFPFVCGSMQQRDPAIYLGTRDGYVFKVYGQTGRSAGGK